MLWPEQRCLRCSPLSVLVPVEFTKNRVSDDGLKERESRRQFLPGTSGFAKRTRGCETPIVAMGVSPTQCPSSSTTTSCASSRQRPQCRRTRRHGRPSTTSSKLTSYQSEIGIPFNPTDFTFITQTVRHRYHIRICDFVSFTFRYVPLYVVLDFGFLRPCICRLRHVRIPEPLLSAFSSSSTITSQSAILPFP